MAHEVLSEKMEAFCIHFIRSGNAADAYRNSHDVSAELRDDWLYVEACQMLNHPKVAPRIKELREKATEVAAYGILDAMDEYDEARKLAIKDGMPAAAVSAINGKVKILGLDNKPVKLHHTSPDGSMTPAPAFQFTNLSDEELAHLERLTDKAGLSKGVGAPD